MTKPVFSAPDLSAEAEEASMTYEGRESAAGAVQQRHERQLLAIDGVEGVGVGQDAIGDETIVVYVRDAGVAQRLPDKLEGRSVQVTVTGPVTTLRRP